VKESERKWHGNKKGLNEREREGKYGHQKYLGKLARNLQVY
jgi:hypothetical protein